MPARGADRADGGEAGGKARADHARIEKHAMPVRLMREHGARHHVARRQIAPCHEAGAGLVDEHRAFAAHGLGDQRQRRAAGIQGGRVELHEFQMLQLGAGLGGEDQAGADRPGRVGAVAEQPANAAGGEQHAVGRQGDGAGGGLPPARRPSRRRGRRSLRAAAGRNSIEAVARAAAISARMISAPVWSPLACRMRGR